MIRLLGADWRFGVDRDDRRGGRSAGVARQRVRRGEFMLARRQRTVVKLHAPVALGGSGTEWLAPSKTLIMLLATAVPFNYLGPPIGNAIGNNAMSRDNEAMAGAAGATASGLLRQRQ